MNAYPRVPNALNVYVVNVLVRRTYESPHNYFPSSTGAFAITEANGQAIPELAPYAPSVFLQGTHDSESPARPPHVTYPFSLFPLHAYNWKCTPAHEFTHVLTNAGHVLSGVNLVADYPVRIEEPKDEAGWSRRLRKAQEEVMRNHILVR